MVERRGMICSLHNSSTLSSTSPFSLPFRRYLFGPTFLYSTSEEQKILLIRLKHVNSEQCLWLVLVLSYSFSYWRPWLMCGPPVSWNNILHGIIASCVTGEPSSLQRGGDLLLLSVKASQYMLQSISWVVSLRLAQ